MNIISIDECQLEELYQYYVKYTKSSTRYVVLSNDVFIEKLIDHKHVYVAKTTTIIGFISGIIVEDSLYITLCYGDAFVSEALITRLEIYAKEVGVPYSSVHFFNPVSLPWYPMENVQHPCFQGVLLDTELLYTYHNLGYHNHSIQETYYLDLRIFRKPDKKPLIEPYSIRYYDPLQHTGFTEFLEEIHAPHWITVLGENQTLEQPLPLLVALDGIKVIGFAGPLKVEPSGRGYFAGIGVLETYRKLHLGSHLFMDLCSSLQKIGARYMTFYTGQDNPARFIYQQTNASIVAQFATLKKQL